MDAENQVDPFNPRRLTEAGLRVHVPADPEAKATLATVYRERKDRLKVRPRQVKPILKLLGDCNADLVVIAENFEKRLAPNPHDFMLAGTVLFEGVVLAGKLPATIRALEVADILNRV